MTAPWSPDDIVLELAYLERRAVERVRQRAAAEQLGECFTDPAWGHHTEAPRLTQGERP